MKTVLLLLSVALSCAVSALEVINGGIGGHTSRHGVERLDSLLASEKPTILVISYGLNDICYEKVLVDQENFRVNLEKMVALARAKGVREIVLCSVNDVLSESLLRRHTYPDNRDLNAMIAEYNVDIKAIAEKNNCLFVDFNGVLKNNGGVTTAKESLIRNRANSKVDDGIHLTPAGLSLLGNSVAQALQDRVLQSDRILSLGDSVTYGYGGAFPGEVSLRSQSYPAIMAGVLKAKFNEKLTDPAPKKLSNYLFESDFSDDATGTSPRAFVLQRKDGDELKVLEMDGEKVLAATPGIKSSSLFFRTQTLPITPGKYRLMVKTSGAGEFLARAMYYTSAAGTPAGNLSLSNGYARAGEELCFDFELPAKTDKVSLTFNVKSGSVSFSSIRLAPVSFAAGTSTAGKYLLENSRLSVRLADVSSGAGVVSLKNDKNVQFINYTPNPSLWSMTLKAIKVDTSNLPGVVRLSIDPEQDDGGKGKNEDAGADLVISAADVIRLGGSPRAEEKNGVLKLYWENLSIGDESKVLSVWAELSLTPDGRYLYVDGGFDNRSTKYTCFYFVLPQLGGLGAIGGVAADDFLATPFFNGRLIQNPVEKGLFGSSRIFQPNRSGHSMQFDLFYNRGNGLYLGTFDGEQYAKRYLLESSAAGGLNYAVYNIPDNMRKVPQSWRVPYKSGITTFSGDYYDGAQLYREWALQQRWCKEGPVSTRKNLPEWFKEIDEWQILSILSGNKPRFTKMIADIARDFGDLKMGMELCHWGTGHHFHAGTPDRFPLDNDDKEQMAILQDHNWPIMGYLQHTAWSDKSSSYLKNADSSDHLVRNYYGQALKWPDNPGIAEECVIAYPTELWKTILTDTVKEMARNGFRAAYMDSGNHGGTYMNFTPKGSSDSGGGRGYVHENWKLLERLRDESRKIKDDFCFTSESFWEGNIAHLDGFLTVNTTNAYLETDRVSAIPLAQIVYHDYTIMFALWPSNGDVKRDNARGYIAKQGLAFCWGVKPGWNVYNLLYGHDNSSEVISSSRKRYDAYRAGKDYFVNGRMLRTPKVTGSGEKLPLTWNISWGERFYNDIRMDRVLTGFFRNANGNSAVTLFNIDEKEHTVTIDLTDPEYGLSKKNNRMLYPANLPFSFEKGFLKLTIPARSPVVIEFIEQD